MRDPLPSFIGPPPAAILAEGLAREPVVVEVLALAIGMDLEEHVGAAHMASCLP